MSIFTIGDLHLSFYPGSDKAMDVFGHRWFNHHSRIEENWKSVVKSDDTVVIAGDISWGMRLDEALCDLEWIDALPGRKAVIKGNHDLWWTSIGRLNSMFESIKFIQNDCYETLEGIYICGTRGWITPDDDGFTEADEKVYKRELLRLEASLKSAGEGEKLGFLHFPPAAGRSGYSGFMKLFEDYGVKNVYYGHIHGEDGFMGAIQGDYYGTHYRLISADYLNCHLLKVR